MRRFVASLLVVVLGSLVAAAAALGEPRIEVVSNRADLVAGPDALVAVSGVDPSSVRVTLDGSDVTSKFAVRPDGRYLGLLDTLTPGTHELKASTPDGLTSTITLDDHPAGGPVISGPQIQPWLCTTDANGLAKATDAQCNAPATVTWKYRSTDSSKSGFQDYDPKNPPTDVATTTTDQGKTVPYVVRVEEGTQNRGIYEIAVLADPKKPWDAPWADQTAWNHKLYYLFGPSCGTIHSQSTVPSALNDMALSRGFMVAGSSMNVLGNNCSTLTSAESVIMLKEHILARYGPIRYTMGTGCSGGSIGQNVIANAYPGLLQGIQPACTFPDNWTTGIEVDDCHLLINYFRNTSPQLWGAAEQQAFVDGHRDPSDCQAWDTTFAAVEDPRNGCGLPADQMYDPQANPKGCRGTLQDFEIGVVGKRPQSEWIAPEKIAGGFAKSAFDNTGVQYGLGALQAGQITADQFVDLNAKVGGVDIDFDYIPQRSVADTGTGTALYGSGQINDARQLDRVAIIDLQDWSETAEIHTSYHSYALRARLDRDFASHANQIIWTYPASAPILGVAPDATITLKSFLLLDKWLSRVEADHSGDPLAQKVAHDKPGDAVDACFVQDQEVTDQGQCRSLYPYYGSARLVAGEPMTDDVGKCQLKPLNRADYDVTFTDDQWATLQKAFPDGVCDFSRPGVEQVHSVPWTTFADGPGGQALGDPPQAAVSGETGPAAGLGLPAAHRCVSRRHFYLRVRAPHGRRLRSARVYVNGHRVHVLRGKRLRAVIDLRGRPAGVVKVRIVARMRGGRTATSRRTYRTCTARR